MPSGTTEPWMSTIGAPTDGRRSLWGIRSVAMAETVSEAYEGGVKMNKEGNRWTD